MIKLFGQTDKVYTSNGDVVLNPLKAVVRKEDNGDYYLSLELPLEHEEYITEGRIVVANTPQGDQAFRIGNVTKTRKKITTKCWHVFYDTKKYYFVPSFYNSSVKCSVVLPDINANHVYPTPDFTVSSDITQGNKAVNLQSISYYDAIMKLVDIYGGHLVRDNFTFAINGSIGQDRGVVIRYGSNMKDISKAENWDDVCTKVYAFGKENTYRINQSSDPYTYTYPKSVKFPQDNIVRDSYSSRAAYRTALMNDLNSEANAYLASHHDPTITYSLKANIDVVSDIGDTFQVIDEILGVNITTSVLAFDYDCLLEKYTSVDFGNFQKSAKGMGNTLSNVASNQATGIIGGKSLVFNDDNTVSWG